MIYIKKYWFSEETLPDRPKNRGIVSAYLALKPSLWVSLSGGRR
jgi:hypothetical protein